MMDILIFWVGDIVWMSHEVFAVHPRVQRDDVDALNFLSWYYSVVEFEGIASTSEEGVSGFERLNYFESVEKLLQVLTGFDLCVPVAFPLYFDIVTKLFEQSVFSECALVHFLHGSAWTPAP